MGREESDSIALDSLSGSVERIVYSNPENGYCVLRLRPDQKSLPEVVYGGLVTVTGNFPEVSPGEYLRMFGRWVTHPKHGQQFQAERCEFGLPVTLEGIRSYLGSGLIKGIGTRLAERIVQHFGLQTLQVIESEPQRLLEVPDIGEKRARMIVQAWEEQKQVKEIMLFLHSQGVSTNLATKIYKHYGDQAVQVVRNDPYRLAKDIFGVGFKTADRIAQNLGLPNDHPSRIEAGLLFVLQEMVEDGHVFAPVQILAQRAAKLLNIPEDRIPLSLESLRRQEVIVQERLPAAILRMKTLKTVQQPNEHVAQDGVVGQDNQESFQAIYLTPFYRAEVGVAEHLQSLLRCLLTRLSDLPPLFIQLAPSLTTEQQAAVKTALSHPVSVLTGGPGTGKTTTIKAIITGLEAAGKRYALASPTGRAAKRLSEATGRPASTIHRLLGYSPKEGFKHHRKNPLNLDMLVVDEASMLDLILAYHLFQALRPGTHLLFVGDVDQLPSVGAGDVLRDIISSGLVPVTRLSTIFRQAEGSDIIVNAHRIRQGQMPLFSKEDKDFFLFPAETAEEAAEWVVDVVCNRIPSKFGLHPHKDIQVLSPMYRGAAGVTVFNERLQSLLNPPSSKKTEKTLFGQNFRVGDKVMQVQNNYDKEVFNGDIGVVEEINLEDHSLMLDFDGRKVEYDWSEADQLTLAYAVSVHKAQGSEFPAVVIPLVTAHYMMLQRNLLYTAVTRAKRLCVLVGSQRAIGMAVRNDKIANRHSALGWRLQKAL